MSTRRRCGNMRVTCGRKETRIKDGKAMIDELRGELVDVQNELKRSK